MSQNDTKNISPLTAALVGFAVGVATIYFMRKEDREKVVNKVNSIKTKATDVIDKTRQTVEATTKDLSDWAQEVGEKAEEQANQIESQAKKRKL